MGGVGEYLPKSDVNESEVKVMLLNTAFSSQCWEILELQDKYAPSSFEQLKVNFIEKYTEKQLPSESTLRKNYLPDCYADALNQIRKAVGNNKIWVSVDETTDETGRFVAHVVVGTLSPDGPGEKFLLTAEVLDKVNHASIVTLFQNSMSLLWPDGVKRENILLLVTDGAAYMMKARRQIKLSYPNICHMTFAIAKELVSEQLRDHIMYIEQKFEDFSKYIKLLETSAMEISKSLKVVQDLYTALDQQHKSQGPGLGYDDQNHELKKEREDENEKEKEGEGKGRDEEGERKEEVKNIVRGKKKKLRRGKYENEENQCAKGPHTRRDFPKSTERGIKKGFLAP
ncbi:hypothetical protein ANN_01782 [Periplaneta americana]|uniref:DUF659 domain-containing protein n=1 Tax=Periplaneta americana TaxID=6978 RepID=A0ABQ8TWW0_PERAM|nr:hypothetical protein ANN_01782 [Periplaneta americana]